MHILVTGSTGFIGRKISKRFIEKGYKVIGIDIVEPKIGFVESENFQYYKLNLSNNYEVLNFANELDVDKIKIFHIAGSKQDSDVVSNDLWETIFNDNILTTHNIINGFKSRIDYFCYSSTMSVYGKPLEDFVDEQHSENPITAYGASKLICEKLIFSLASHYGFRSLTLRISSVFDKHHLSKAIQNFKVAIENKQDITIYGSRAVARDYVHVNDLTDAFDQANENQVCGVINVGSGIKTPLELVIDSLQANKSEKVKIKYDDTKVKSFDFAFNIDKAKRELNFNPLIKIEQELAYV